MEETIHGTTMPVLELSLQAGESVVSEAGEFSWMSDAIQMPPTPAAAWAARGSWAPSSGPSPVPPS